MTYAEYGDTVENLARGLLAAGIRPGEVVAVFLPNCWEFCASYHAITLAGAVPTLLNPSYREREVRYQLENSGAAMLISNGCNLEGIALAGIQKLRRVYTTREASLGAEDFSTLLKPSTSTFSQPQASSEQTIAALPYSSGTTGLPKGVMLSHRNLVANILQVDSAGHLRDGDDTLVSFLPFFHIYGLVVIMLLGLRSGASIVVMPRFDLETYLDLVERHRATMLHVVPPIVLALAKTPSSRARDLASVRKLFSGAAPLGADVIRQCTARVGCFLQQGYGLTESSPATHTTPDDPANMKPGSIGAPVANTECRVVDPATREDVDPGQDGEIWIRGPQVMLGYLNCPDATRATVDHEGWLHTGDIGHADADGDFFIVDRLKELIKYKGMQIAPAELESLLLSHPAVADAAVVSQKDEAAGEIPRAFVVLKAPATADDLMIFVAGRVASYKKIRRLDFIDAIPKSPSGKILRRVLRDTYCQPG